MNKLMTVVAASVCAVSLSGSAVAAEDPEVKSDREVAEEMEEESAQIFEAGFDLDWFSAYVWRNAVQTDRMVLQPCVWADLTCFEPFWLGFFIWQNYDLSHRRGAIYRYGLNETDYNVHLGATPWTSDDEDLSLDLEIGHDWYTYHGVRNEFYEEGGRLRDDYPNTEELYVKATFNNPFVTVYGQASWMYRDVGFYEQGMHYELGFTKEIELCDSLTLGADWNVNFADSNYLNFLFGGVSNPYFAEVVDENGDVVGGELADDYDGAPKGGFAGTTLKAYLAWQITDWMTLQGTVAYTGLLNGALRESAGDQGDDYDFNGTGCDYHRDLLWGGLSLKFAF